MWLRGTNQGMLVRTLLIIIVIDAVVGPRQSSVLVKQLRSPLSFIRRASKQAKSPYREMKSSVMHSSCSVKLCINLYILQPSELHLNRPSAKNLAVNTVLHEVISYM
jgi:hypothetical protein